MTWFFDGSLACADYDGITRYGQIFITFVGYYRDNIYFV